MKKLFALLLILTGTKAFAADLKSYSVTVKDGKFSPEQITVAKGEKFKLEVKNDGNAAEEFESTELNREKIVAAHQTITVLLGPLSEGEYKFFGDFHPDTAKGKIIVK